MALTPNTPPFVSGAILTAQQMTNLPMGLVALTSNATTTITANYLTGSNTTFTFVANRNYRITVVNGWSSTGNCLLEIEIDGTVVQRYFDNRFATRTASDQFFNTNGVYVGSVAAGSKTVKVKVNSISGTLTNQATATAPNQVIIEDIGTA